MDDDVAVEDLDTEGTEPAEVDEQPEASEAESEATEHVSLDLDQYGNHMVSVKVGGEERMVPVSEAVSGFMMQEDYTRKTQEVASQREQLARAAAIQSALEKDPAGTIQALAEFYGANGSQAEPDDLDPEEARIVRLERAWEAQERQRQAQEVQSTLQSLHTTHGDFSDAELIRFAVDNEIRDLNVAYRAFAFDQARTQVQGEAEERKREADQKVVDQKRAAAVVEGGGNRQGATEPTGPQGPVSMRDAFELARRQVTGRR